VSFGSVLGSRMRVFVPVLGEKMVPLGPQAPPQLEGTSYFWWVGGLT